MKKGKGIALLPIGVFLVLYLGLGILFEYVMEIPMGFYNVPIVVAFLAAILVACLQNRALDFDKKLEIMAQGVGDKNIITMLLIFLAAGSFVGVVGRSSAESVAYCMLSLIPARFSVSVLFIVACFVSVAMGTSVGTITLLTPIAAAVSTASGFDLAFCVASVMGGAMFGDNLSFISDTTIAACNGQGCEMKDKFRENFWIALPAAVATLILILILSFQTEIQGRVERAAKEKQPREFREPKEKQVREKTTKPVKPVEILTDPEEIKEVENRAKVFLRDVFASMNLGEVEITSEYNTTDGSLEVDFEGEDMGILIGKRGQTLDSLQYLTSLVVNKGKSNYIRVKLDTEDYRKRRKETLENLARGIAYKVRKTRKPVILEPMNPYERRIIHSALQGNKFVETVSEGEEPYRHVVVKLKRN